MTATLAVARDRDPTPAWSELAGASGAFYDDPRWITGMTAFFRYPLFCLTARENGVVRAGLALARVPALIGPARLVSLPFSYVGGVIGAAPEASDALGDAARQLAVECRARRVEIKHRAARLPPAPGFQRSTHYAAYRVATAGGEEDVWQRLHQTTRRSIQKGRKDGVAVAPAADRDDWLAMAVLQEGTSRRHGTPPPPRAFFTTFCRALQRDGLSDLYLARVAGRIAAGLVVWKGRAEWIYAFGASDPRWLEHRPNHALLWAALRDAMTAGVPFDLGRAAPEQAGLVEFKRRWGGQPMPLAYDYWPVAGGLNVRRRDGGLLGLAARVYSALPPPLVRLSAPLYRYLG